MKKTCPPVRLSQKQQIVYSGAMKNRQQQQPVVLHVAWLVPTKRRRINPYVMFERDHGLLCLLSITQKQQPSTERQPVVSFYEQNIPK